MARTGSSVQEFSAYEFDEAPGLLGLVAPSSLRRAEGMAVVFLGEGEETPFLDSVVVPATRPLAEFAAGS